MLLAIDVGNTSITFGAFKGKRLVRTFRISSGQRLEAYDALLRREIKKNRIKAVDAVIICSVVPRLTSAIEKAVRHIFGLTPFVLGKNIKAPIKNNYKNPKQVGQDRLVDAVATREIYGVPAIIVDSGTAITFDFISKKGEYEGGLIVPGIDISLKALYEKTALLPDVKLKDDKGFTLVGRDTVNSIKSGFLNGFGSLADGVIMRLRKKYGRQSKVIGTGGYIGLIKKYSSSIGVIDEFLTLKGLKIIYQKKLAPQKLLRHQARNSRNSGIPLSGKRQLAFFA